MATETTTPGALQFAEFAFDPARGQLFRNGTALPLEKQPAMVLKVLLTAGGRLVSREELANIVWGSSGTHVNFDAGLNYCIRRIRAVLGDDPRAPRFVATLPKRGYQFIAPVVMVSPPAPRRTRPAVYAAVGLTIVVLTALIESRPNNHHALAVSAVQAVHDLLY